MKQEIGQLLNNRYQILELLNEGGMGTVYRAHDNNLNILVAIKKNIRAWSKAQEQFIQEARLLARLSHRNLPRVTDFFTNDTDQYLVMDFVEGRDLAETLQHSSPLSERKILPWIIQICEALAYLHLQSPPIFHRDIKPANIKIRTDEQVMLVDFGIAKVATEDDLKTTTGAKGVTRGYSPPEQYRSGGTDGRSDIYALGATLYHLLTGQKPPESIDLYETPLVPPRKINPYLSSDVERVILKAMCILPEQRFQTVQELQQELSSIKARMEEIQPTEPETTFSISLNRKPKPQETGILIKNRYKLEIEMPDITLCEVWMATDLRNESGDMVQVYLVNMAKAGELVHNIVLRQAKEFTRSLSTAHIAMQDYGYDLKNNAYYFVYPIRMGTRLNTYLEEAKPSLSWSFDLLVSLTEFLNDVHGRELVHGDLRSDNIYVTDASQHKIVVLHTGLTTLVKLLNKHDVTSGTTDFDQLKRIDIAAFSQITRELLCLKANPTQLDLEQVLDSIPGNLKESVRQITADNNELQLNNSADLKIVVLKIRRLLEGENLYYLSLTNRAVAKLNDLGFIPQKREYMASGLVQKELDQGTFAWSQDSHDGQDRMYRLTTSQFSFRCAPDRQNTPPRNLVVVDVWLDEPARLAQYREQGLRINRRLQLRELKLIPNNSDVTPLIKQIDNYVEQKLLTRDKELSHKDNLKDWEDLLAMQRRLLRAFTLKYIDWKETDEGAAVNVTLAETPQEDNLNITFDELLCLTSQQYGRQQSVGYYEDLSGNVLKLGLAHNVNLSEFKKDGVLTVDNYQAQEVVDRQQRAIKRLRFFETVNPELPNLLTNPERLSIDNPTAINMWFQSKLDEAQRKAVRRALATRDIFLVQGPPGTGKTSVIAELILQIIEREGQTSILVSSQSNVAVNNVLDKVRELRPDLAEFIVRVGHEEKAGTVQDLMLDRQLYNWSKEVVFRSDKYMAELEAKLDGAKEFTEALGVLAECQDAQQQQEQLQIELDHAKQRLANLEKEYEQLNDSINQITQLQQQAESILSSASPEDDRLHQIMKSFQNDYLTWANGFLERANQMAGVSFQYVDAKDAVEILHAKLSSLENEIRIGIELVNEFLQDKFGVMFNSIIEQKRFINRQQFGKQEEIARLGRLRKIVIDWKQRVGKSQRDFSSAYLTHCKIVGATCIGVAAKGDVNKVEFDWVIVDEAGRATPPELLVPIIRGQRIVLVGDHRQLPPTVNKEMDEAIEQLDGVSRTMFQTSLFQQLMERGTNQVQLPLTIQYRMHPTIGRLISKCFYEEKLENGVGSQERLHGIAWLSHPVIWFSTKDLPHHDEISEGYSYRNDAEIEVITRLLDRINATYTQTNITGKTIGLITGYQPQKAALRRQVSANTQRWQKLPDIEVNTVDAYQGRERDIIIYSVVRSNRKGKIGFLQDVRRLNVALSRARELLIIVGNEDIENADVRGQNPFYDVINHIRSDKDCALEVFKYGHS